MKHGKLHLNVDMAGSEILIEIEDNGLGQKKVLDMEYPLIDVPNTDFEIYLELLNQFSKSRIRYKVKEKVDIDQYPRGTRMSINIPIPFDFSYDFLDSYDKLVGSN